MICVIKNRIHFFVNHVNVNIFYFIQMTFSIMEQLAFSEFVLSSKINKTIFSLFIGQIEFLK